MTTYTVQADGATPTFSRVSLMGNYGYAGVSSETNSKLYSDTFITGSTSRDASAMAGPYRILVSDQVDADGGLDYLTVKAGVGGPNTGTATTGGVRQGMVVVVSQNGYWKTGEYPDVIGAQIAGWGNYFSGAETAVNYTDFKGSVFGFNPTANLTKSGSKWALVNGMELNVQVHAGVEVASKYGMTIIGTSLDAVRGTFDDAALAISNQGTALTTWAKGLQFGSHAGQWPFDDDSTIISSKATAVGPLVGQPLLAQYGVDFSNLTITTGGAGVVMPLITPSAANAPGKAGSIVWDANYIYVCVATDTWKRAAIETW